MLRQDSLVADATTPRKRRLQALIDYVAQTGRARSKVVSNVTDHGLFLLFEHQLAAVDGSRLNDTGADGEDDIWLTVSRPPGPELPPRPDNPWLAPWLARPLTWRLIDLGVAAMMFAIAAQLAFAS